MKSKKEIVKIASCSLPTRFGTYKLLIYRSLADGKEHSVLIMGEKLEEPILTRLHSQCLTGDTLFSLRCDCGDQLKMSLRRIQKAGAGIVIYLNQEGRGIGLANKIKAYALQEKGYDTVEANKKLGLPQDARGYRVAALILKDLGVSKINLLTNNPDKEKQLSEYEITVLERIPLETLPNKVNTNYLKVKKQKLGHSLKLV